MQWFCFWINTIHPLNLRKKYPSKHLYITDTSHTWTNKQTLSFAHLWMGDCEMGSAFTAFLNRVFQPCDAMERTQLALSVSRWGSEPWEGEMWGISDGDSGLNPSSAISQLCDLGPVTSLSGPPILSVKRGQNETMHTPCSVAPWCVTCAH